MTRDLFIGLGGTGANTLKLLYSRMTDEQRRNAHYVYLDTDQKDINRMQQEGIRAIRISSANTVGELAAGLGRDDGVQEWLPWNEREGIFLNSGVDDGASQYRYKSRLCLARFLRSPNNELHALLESLTPPGADLENERMRVIIVSSIAGGTGAGTFIELALYIRKFFRNYAQNYISITGILACPDLYTKLVKDTEEDADTQRISMYANAYAAIRELNAMNLATSAAATSNDYGKKIHIRIDTRSEGKLFDSDDPEFKSNTRAKPFDLIYFIDEANSKGGILSNIHQYYAVMADLAYARLYSPLETSIGSGESNELDKHISAPTAIYGSAGYARIRYPYEDILKYLAERKIAEEIDARWCLFDDQWHAECEAEQDIASQSGHIWQPAPDLRGKRYMEYLNADLADEEHGNFHFLKDMVNNSYGQCRVKDFMDSIDQAASLGVVTESGISGSGTYSICRDTEVDEAVRQIMRDCRGKADSALEQLRMVSRDVDSHWSRLLAALRQSISGQANRLASAIFPYTATMLENAQKNKLPINLHWGLLCYGEGKDVHPIAARYLLYSLRENLSRICGERAGNGSRVDFEQQLSNHSKGIRLAFDDNPDDSEDFTVEDEIASLRRVLRPNKREVYAKMSLEEYREKVRSCVNDVLNDAKAECLRVAFRRLSRHLEEMVAQYENFFENLRRYQQELQHTVNIDYVMHDSNRNQVIFVGASSRVKDYYYAVQPSVVAALEGGNIACYSAAGAGVYEALEKRTLEALDNMKIASRIGQGGENPDRFDDMSGIFATIIQRFQAYLRKNAAYLKTDAVGALVHEICAELNIEEGDINSNPSNLTSFRLAFRRRMEDLEAKAMPMIRYNQENRRKYFVEEENSPNTDLSLLHRYYGISPESAKKLAQCFPTNSRENPLAEFSTFLGTENVVQSDQFSDYEIFCFCAVHCLQPNQIYRFDEMQAESYYGPYKQRVHTAIETGMLSKSPHIDKRWHLKGAMPYISKELELQWRGNIMKAFIYQILTRGLRFTIDRDGRQCFLRRDNGETYFVEWPARQPVLTRNISRLVEFLAEDELLVESSAKKLDELVDASILRNANYSDSVGLYKMGMTKDLLLKRMRTDALSFFKTDQNEGSMTEEERAIAREIRRALGAERNQPMEKDEEEIVNLNATMGGILRIAYRLHMSEEKLDEDRDFGEALLEAVAQIIDRYATGMYGVTHVSGTAKYHREYVSIYNWAMDRFLDSWIEQASREKRLSGAKLTADIVEEEDDLMKLITGVKTTVKGVPKEIQQSEEYSWILANWKYKSF